MRDHLDLLVDDVQSVSREGLLNLFLIAISIYMLILMQTSPRLQELTERNSPLQWDEREYLIRTCSNT